MSSVPVSCPHCKKKNYLDVDFDFGDDHAMFQNQECEHCDKYYGCEITSEIRVEGCWKEDDPLEKEETA